MDRPQVIQKIKDLLKLASSANEHEAASAKTFADRLIQKHQIADSEIQDEESPFKPENFLFRTEGIVAWKMALASALSDYFYCTLLQMQNTDQFGKITMEYTLFGEPEDIQICQVWFEDFIIKIQKSIETCTTGRGEQYIFSFSQGLADGVQKLLNEVQVEVKRDKTKKKQGESKEAVVHISGKEIKKPSGIDQVTSSRQEGGQQVLDPRAYFAGVTIGSTLPLPKTLAPAETN